MNRTITLLLLSAIPFVAGCKNDFAPQSDLASLRVLALVANPLELAPTESVTVLAEEFVPASIQVASRRWSFCPVTAGAVSAYACAVPQCEVQLTPDPGGLSVTANPTAILLQCLGWTSGQVPPQAPEVLQTVFRYRVESTDGQVREAILQIPQWTRRAPTDPNLPPVITDVIIGGVSTRGGAPLPVLKAGQSLPVNLLIDPLSVQTYVDAAGVTTTETMTGYFYTSAGTFSDSITTGVNTTSQLEGSNLPAGTPFALVYVVALDLRGGQEVAGPFSVPIEP